MEQKLIDNKQHGLVGDHLKKYIKEESKLSIASAYFTLYAFEELKEELDKVDEFRFLFTNPTFVKSKNKIIQDKIKQNEQKLFGEEEELIYKNNLNQAYIARELSKYIKNKAEIKTMISKSIRESIFYIEDENGDDVSITGGVPLSASGLGYTNSNSISNNQLTDSKDFNKNLKNTFDNIWRGFQPQELGLDILFF